MLRFIKVLLVLTVAGFGFLGALGNVADWNGTLGAITAATSMSTFDGGAESWRATTSPLLIGIAAVMIPLMKCTSGVLCAWGAWCSRQLAIPWIEAQRRR
jgi:predicted small integral membrane protein